jgi:hypothetical protein
VVHMAWDRHVAQQHKCSGGECGGVRTGRVRAAPQKDNLFDIKAQRRVGVLERVAHTWPNTPISAYSAIVKHCDVGDKAPPNTLIGKVKQ